MKKLLSLALALVLCLGLIPTVALAAESDFVIENGVLERYDGPGGDVVIPYNITEIGPHAFWFKDITSVIIGPNVTKIGWNAFEGCRELACVTLSEGLITIEENAFEGCKKLTSITIPYSVQTIQCGAFSSCSSLQNINFQNPDVDIGGGAFGYTPWLSAQKDEFVTIGTTLLYYQGTASEITIPNNITRIADGAFARVKDVLTQVTIPDSVTEIGPDVFSSCAQLTSISLPSSVTKIGRGAFKYSGLTSIELPPNIKEIEADTFRDCEDLTNVTIPHGVEKIGQGAFSECEKLTNVTIPTSVTEIGPDAFGELYGRYDIPTIHGAKGSKAELYARKGYEYLEGSFGGTHYKRYHPLPFVEEDLPAPTSNLPTAYVADQHVDVDGELVFFRCFALKDANGNLTNYIRVRDLAYILNGTPAQFEVGYQDIVNLTPGQAYTPTGTEMRSPNGGDQPYTKPQNQTNVGGTLVDLDAILLTDVVGGYTYYQLRDLGQALDFNVGWSADKGVFIETDKPYDPAN